MRVVFVVAVVCAFSCMFLGADAAGQMFVDRIEPVKDTRVNFLSNLASPDAILGEATTDTLVVLKQFELQIPVEDVVLTGSDGISFNGNLGAAFTTSEGDVNFDAENGSVLLTGTNFDFDATNDVDLTSLNGDIELTSALNTEFVAGGLDFDIGSGGIDMSAAGDIQLRSRNAVNLKAGNTLALQNQEEVDLVVGGDSSITSGDQFIMSAGNGITGDATFDAQFRSVEALSIVSGGDGVFFSGQQANLISVGEFLVEGSTFSANAQEELRLIGGAVCADVRQVSISALGVGANVEVHADSVNLCAADEVSLSATGISSDVVIDTTDGFTSTSASIAVDSGYDTLIGDVTTNDVTISASSGFVVESTDANIHADEDLALSAGNSIQMTSDDDTLHLAVDYMVTGNERLSIAADEFIINSNVGDSQKDIDFDSGSNIIWTASDIDLETFQFDLAADALVIVADDIDMTTDSQYSVLFSGATIDVSSTTVDVTTSQFQAEALGALSITVAQSIELIAAEVDMYAEDDLVITAASNLALSSAGDMLLASNMMSITSDDAYDTTLSGSARFDVDDLVFTSNAELTAAASGSHFWTLADDLTVTGFEINIEVEDELYVKTSDLNFSSDSVTFDSDDVVSQFDSIDFVGGDISILASEELTFDSANDLLIDILGAVTIDVDDSIRGTAADINTLSAGGQAAFSAGDDLELAGSGPFSFTSAGDLVVTGDDLAFFTAGTVAWIGSETFDMSSAAGVIDIAAGDFTAQAGDDLTFTAGSNFDFVKGGQATSLDTITLFGMNLDFDADFVTFTSTGTTHFNVGSIDFNGGGDFSISGDEILINGESVTVGSAQGPIVIDSDVVVIESGAEEPFTTTAAVNIEFTDTAAGGITIDSEADAFYTAGDEITFTATNDVVFRGEFDVRVSAATDITVAATATDGRINSYEDLFFVSGEDQDITVTSTAGSDNVSFGRNALMVANGQNGLTNCGITITAEDTHTYSTFGNSYGGGAGDLEVLAEDSIEIHSIDTLLTTDPFGSSLPTGSGAGSITGASDGHMFFHSEESGVVFITEGPGLTVDTDSTEGNVEIIAHDAYMRILAEAAFGATSASASIEILADQGFTEFAEEDISFTSDDLLVHSARGLDFAANAMVVNGDTTTVEVQDSFTVQQYGSADGGILFSVTDDFTSLVFDGRLTVFNASNDLTIDSNRDVQFSATDGRIVFDADFGDLTFTSEDALTVESAEGPVSFATRGEGGSMAIEADDWVFTSSESFIRMFSQDATTISAGDDFNVNADGNFPPGPGHCLSIETERPNDSVTITGTAGIAMVATSNGNQLARDRFVIAGNNIDAENNSDVAFTLSDLFEVGTTQTPGGEPSYQPVIRVISNTASFTSTAGDIDIKTDNTFNSESELNTAVVAQTASFDSNGSMTIVAQAPAGATADITVTAATNVMATAPVLTQTGPASFVATAVGSVYIESSGDDIGDRLDVLAGQDLLINALDYSSQANVHNVVADVIDFTSANSILIANLINPAEPSELGTIRIQSAEELDMDAAASMTFSQTAANGRASFTALEELGFVGGAPLTVATNGISESGIDLSAAEEILITATTSVSVTTTPGSAYFSPALNNNQDASSGSIVFESTDDFELLTAVSLTTVSNANTTFTSAANAVELTFADRMDIVYGTAAPDYESELAILSRESDIGWDATTLVFNGQAGADGLWEVTADDSVQFEAIDFTLVATNQVLFNAEVIDLTDISTTLTLTTGDDIRFVTEGPGSNIELDDPSPAQISAATAILSSAGGASSYDVDGDATFTAAASYTVEVDSGDVLFVATGDLIATAQAIVFEAAGTSDYGHGISIDAEASFFTATADIEFDAREFQFFRVSGPTSLSADAEMNIITYNANSNIEFLSRDDFQVTPSIDLTVSSPDFDVGATTVLLQGAASVFLTTDLPFTNVLVTTNPSDENYGGTFQDSASSRLVNANDVVFRSGDGGATGVIESNSSTFISLSAVSTTGDGLQFIAEEGTAVLQGIGMSITALAGDVSFNSGTGSVVSMTTALSETAAYVSFESEHGRVRLLQSSAAAMAVTSGSLLMETLGYGHERDISIASEDSLTVSSTTLDVQALGGDGSINFVANDAISTSSNSVTFATGLAYETVADAGIRFLTTNRNGINTPTGFSASAGTTVLIRTLNFLDDIFFDSDYRVRFNAPSATGFISHTRYNYRLGFFSVNPAHIHLVNMQNADQCIETGWCGFANPPNVGNANGAIGNVSSVSRQLQNILRNYGLINWKNPIV